jgi:type I restriction enzyme S subunit
MAFKQVRLGDYFKFEKGLGYKGEFLVEESNVGLVGIDSQVPGGGYKENSEKPYSGPYRPEHVVDVGDVIVAATDITQDGSVLGSTLMIPERTNFESLIYSGDVMKAIPLKPDEFSLEFFYNLYRIEKYRKKVAYGDTGTTVRRLSEDGICEQIVPLPDLPTQQAINEIISLIDQQISNNKALSRNLEALAQSVYKSWFIDFDPVYSKKLAEKPLGMDAETAKLFPDSFVKSEFGEIPKGWKFHDISQVIKFCGGGTPSTKNSEYWDGEHLWTTPRDLSRQIGIITIDTERKLTDAGISKISSKLLPRHSVLMSSRAPIGYLTVAAFPTAINQGFIGFPFQKPYSPLYILNWLHFNMHEIKSRSGGGTFAEINRTSFKSIPFLFSSDELLLKFEQLMEPSLIKLESNAIENALLERTRVRLLSGLIDGEIELPAGLIAS